MKKFLATSATATALIATALLSTAFSADAATGSADRALPSFGPCDLNYQSVEVSDNRYVLARTIAASGSIYAGCGAVKVTQSLFVVSPDGEILYQKTNNGSRIDLDWNFAAGQTVHLHSVFQQGNTTSPAYIAVIDADGNAIYSQV